MLGVHLMRISRHSNWNQNWHRCERDMLCSAELMLPRYHFQTTAGRQPSYLDAPVSRLTSDPTRSAKLMPHSTQNAMSGGLV